MTDQKTYDTGVLVIGSGPAGASAALLLATYGIDTMMVNKYGWVATTPRAHITNQRTMEVLRDLGVEDEAIAAGSAQEIIGDTVLCTSLAGEEIGRIGSWGAGDAQLTEYTQASPSPMIDLPQTYLEPILVTNAAKRGAKCRFDTEFVSLEQDADGVTATLRDRLRGDEYTVRARYLIGTDGARSLVAEQIGLPIAGRPGVGGSMNICFTADLSKYVAHRPSVLSWATTASTCRSIRPRCGRSTTATPPRTRPAGCSAPATPCTGTRRRTGSARTPRSRIRSTWPGSWPR